jgi:hypothetical protein
VNTDGTFRYFQIDSNTAVFTSKGKWKIGKEEMVWSGISRSYFYHGAFRKWDTLTSPDTSYLRKVTDSGFERLEATYDSQFASTAQWVKYRRLPDPNPLPEGAYVFSETYRNAIDTAVTDTDSTRLEITHEGSYVQKLFTNGILASMDVDSQWTQVGNYLITSRNRYCSYDTGSSYCGDSPADFEYVARLEDIEEKGFHVWIPAGSSIQGVSFWADFRKAP